MLQSTKEEIATFLFIEYNLIKRNIKPLITGLGGIIIPLLTITLV